MRDPTARAAERVPLVSQAPPRPGLNGLTDAEKKRQARELNALIDAYLLEPGGLLPGELAGWLGAWGAPSLAERVRRRATRLSRGDRGHADVILATRDAVILALYAFAAADGAFTAWSDGSVAQAGAGIGGLLMDPEGRIVDRLSHPGRWPDAFSAEVAALEAVMGAAVTRGAGRLRVYTDCLALLRLWLEKRGDPRLQQVRQLAGRFKGFDLQALPRLHNQPANRLARQALAGAAGSATYTGP